MPESTPQSSAKEQLREFRRVVANAVAELRSKEVRDTYAALSLEELMDQHVARMEETTDPINPSRLQRLRRVRDELVAKIEAMKATPPDNFRRHNSSSDVNTDPETA